MKTYGEALAAVAERKRHPTFTAAFAARTPAAPAEVASSTDDEPLMRLMEVAVFLGVSEKTVRKLTVKHGLRFVRVGRELRFRREWVNEYIDRVRR